MHWRNLGAKLNVIILSDEGFVSERIKHRWGRPRVFHRWTGCVRPGISGTHHLTASDCQNIPRRLYFVHRGSLL